MELLLLSDRHRYQHGTIDGVNVILLFLGFLYYRHKHRPENLSSEYFLKKANELSANIN